MRYGALLLLLIGLAMAPMASAVTLPTPETCASECCETDPDCCAAACPCPPQSCHVSAVPTVMIPAGQAVFIFTPDNATSLLLSDMTCSQRTARPPVPPPRA